MRIILLILLNLFPFKVSSIENLVEVSKSPMTGMLTFPIFFISDSQFHNYLTDPSIIRSNLADKAVSVAIRPPLLNLFAQDLYLFALEKYSRNNWVIFLGDAIDISCKSEWNRFEEVMNNGIHNGWVMLPGNHDSFFFGNTLSVSNMLNSPVLKSWKDACNTVYPPLKEEVSKNLIFTKDLFVKNYYRNLLNQGKENQIDFPTAEDVDCNLKPGKNKNVWYERGTPITICDWKNKNQNGFIQKIRLTFPHKEEIRVSYRSYILQEINLSKFFDLDFKIKGILLDTSDFRNTPTLVTGAVRGIIHLPGTKLNAGINGGLGLDQIETIKRWIRENDPNTFYIFMGHHPFDSLTKETMESFKEILKLSRNGVYISSHTHEGFIKNHGNFQEINTGSITDFPNQTMMLSFKNFGKGSDSMGFWPNTTYFTLEGLIKEGVCSTEDDADKDANSYYHYLAYKELPGLGTPNQVHEFTIDNNLMALYKVFNKLGLYKDTEDPILRKLEDMVVKSPVKCGPLIGKKNRKCRINKFNLQKQVVEIDRSLYSSSLRDERIKYGACQALWAAQAESKISKK